MLQTHQDQWPCPAMTMSILPSVLEIKGNYPAVRLHLSWGSPICSQWVCSSWDALTDRNATVAILGLTPTGINRAFSDVCCFFFFFTSSWQTHISVVKKPLTLRTACVIVHKNQIHFQTSWQQANNCTLRDIWLFVSELHKPGSLVAFYKSRVPLRTFQTTIYTQIFSTSNLPSTCWGQPQNVIVFHRPVPQIVIVSKTLQPEKRTGVGGVMDPFKVFVQKGLVTFNNSVSSGYLLYFFFCLFLFHLLVNLLFSCTSLCVHSLLVEGGWLKLKADNSCRASTS